ncbi:MAG: hypothetical protein RI884_1519 [Pseudomonadota bacterium]
MNLAVPRGRPGAVLALVVLCAHVLTLQALRPLPPTTSGPALAPSLRIHPVEVTAVRATPSHAPPVPPTPKATDHASRKWPAPVAPAATPPSGATPRAPGIHATDFGTEAVPARIAPPIRLHYEVTGHARERPVSGRAELAWQHDGQRYEAHLEQDGEGLARRRQHSAGHLTPQGLAPQRYAERTRHEEAVHFERDTQPTGRAAVAGRAVFSANRPPAPLQPDAQDRLSLLLQLGARIAARPRAYPAGSWLEIQAATTREALVWRFQIEGTEELQLPGGHQTTLRLVRLPVGEFEPRLEVWLAPGLDYAPVRMRLTQRAGDHLDYQWSGTDKR